MAFLAIRGRCAHFLGSADVCDYQDIVTVAGREADVVRGMVDYLGRNGIRRMDLETVRPDASVVRGLDLLAASGAASIARSTCDVTFETVLPTSWEGYLGQLSGKQRHEVRRKIRRLETGSPYRYRKAGTGAAFRADIETFLTLFRMNRSDKAAFMNDGMAAYFEVLMNTLADHDLLRLFMLELDGRPASAVLCFDFNGVRYLYNSAYDDRFQAFSVGILSKVFSISEAIDSGCRRYDFLKGAETYKKRIGGGQVDLYRYTVEW
jgi:CelD/BcsL family acetyltransferase involved in cellulose biosynthesis